MVAFVAIGRDTHDESSTLSGILGTALPFLIALVVAWVVTKAWLTPAWSKTGAVVASLTMAVGMFLRNIWFDEGTALSFVIVTVVFLGLTMVGWRLGVTEINRRRRQASIEPSK